MSQITAGSTRWRGSRRGRIVVGVAVALVVSVGVAAPTRPQPTRPPVPAAPYVAESGVVFVSTPGGPAVLETSHQPGGNALLDADASVLAAAGPTSFEDFIAGHWVVESILTEDARSVSTARLDERGLLLHSHNADTEHGFEVDSAATFTYQPPLTIIPADPAPGQEWTESVTRSRGDGSATDTLTRHGRIEDAGSGCLAITVTDEVGSAQDVGGAQETATTVRCPDQVGLTRLGGPEDNRRIDGSPPWRTPPPDLTVTPGPTTDLVPAADRMTIFGQEYLPGVDVAPVPLGDGLAVANTHTGHVLGVVPSRDGTTLEIDWRRRPGAAVTELLGAGDLVVAATSDRALVALDRDGLVRWQAHTPDVTVVPLLRIDEDTVAHIGMDGTVSAHSLRTGELIWSQRTPLRGQLLAVSGPAPGSVTMASTGAGELAVVDADGTRTIKLDSSVQALTTHQGDLLAVDYGGTLYRISPDGQVRWERSGHSDCTAVAAVADVVACAGSDLRAVGFDDGEPRWRVATRAEDLYPVEEMLVAGGTELLVVDAAGTVRSDLGPMDSRAHVVPGPRGLYRIDATGQLASWEQP